MLKCISLNPCKNETPLSVILLDRDIYISIAIHTNCFKSLKMLLEFEAAAGAGYDWKVLNFKLNDK